MSLRPPTDGTPSTTSIGNVALDARLTVVESGIVVAAAATGVAATDTASLQAAFTAGGGKVVRIPYNGTTYATTAGGLTVLDNTWVRVEDNVTFAPTGTGHGIVFGSPSARTPATRYALTVDGVEGATTVTVSTGNSANFSAGQRVYLRDTQTLGGLEYRKEANLVKSVNTGTGVITLEYPLTYAYAAASSGEIAPATGPQNIRWDGGSINMTGVAAAASDYNGFNIEHGTGCSVNDATVYNHPSKTVEVYASLDCHARRVNGRAPSADGSGQGYGVRLINSRHCSIDGGWGRNLRHTGDISGGTDCEMRGLNAVGRTPTAGSQTAFLLHGLQSKRCRVTNCHASNVAVGFGAGNGSFGADMDFTADGLHFNTCDIGVSVSDGCSGWTVKAKVINSLDRAAAIADSTNWTAEIDADGQTSATNAMVTVSGTCDRGVLRPRLRNAATIAVGITSTLEVTVDEPDIDQGTLAANGISGTSLPATAVVTIRGGNVRMNSSAGVVTGILLTGLNGSILTVDGTKLTGTFVRGVNFTGGTSDCVIRRVKFRGSSLGEQYRIDSGCTGQVLQCDFTASGTAARVATATSVYFEGNVWNDVTTRINNSGGATILGNSRKEGEGSAAPAAGAWQVADRQWNNAVAAAGIPGWVCTTAGSPGTWKAMAAVAA